MAANMKHPSKRILKLPLEKRAQLAFNAAVRKVIEENVRRGIPIYVWRDNRVVDILPEMRRKLRRNRRVA